MPVQTIAGIPTELYLNQALTLVFDLYEADGSTLVSVAPDSVTMEFISPAGVSDVITLGVDNELQQITSPYRYRVNYDKFTSEGYWDWKFVAQWTSTPSIAGDVVLEGRIRVKSNRAKTI